MTIVLPDRSVLAVEGPDRVSFLQGLVTNDVSALAPDRALYAGLLSPQGKLLCDFFLVAVGETILIDVAADAAEDLKRRLQLYKMRASVSLRDASAELGVSVALDGTLGLPAAEGAAKPEPPGAVFIDPRLAALGARIIGPRQAATGDAGAYTLHRFALGIGEGAEIGQERCYPLEANFEALHGVDFRKGCYVGQELTARMKHRGGLRKSVLPVLGADDLPPTGTAVEAGKEIGTLIAAAGKRGLALLRLDRLDEASEPLKAGGVALTVSWPSWLPR
jgi:folate-binding protein YgfZ